MKLKNIAIVAAAAALAVGMTACGSSASSTAASSSVASSAAASSEASDFVNGLILYVDGGILAYIGRQPK